jgi:hypothetical protein
MFTSRASLALFFPSKIAFPQKSRFQSRNPLAHLPFFLQHFSTLFLFCNRGGVGTVSERGGAIITQNLARFLITLFACG